MSISFLNGFSSTSFLALAPNLLCEDPGWLAAGSTFPSLPVALVSPFFGAVSCGFFLFLFLSSFFLFSF